MYAVAPVAGNKIVDVLAFKVRLVALVTRQIEVELPDLVGVHVPEPILIVGFPVDIVP